MQPGLGKLLDNPPFGPGGGAIGPPLIDDKWIYGAGADQIYATISQGRPDGMPSFGGHITTQQIWQLVAYVQSMSGQVKATSAPSRNDDQMAALPESRQSPQVERCASIARRSSGATTPAASSAIAFASGQAILRSFAQTEGQVHPRVRGRAR